MSDKTMMPHAVPVRAVSGDCEVTGQEMASALTWVSERESDRWIFDFLSVLQEREWNILNTKISPDSAK